MPSARELLLQADALMRSNRNVGTDASDEAVPVLTDVAIPPAQAGASGHPGDEVPVLTQVVQPAPPPVFADPSLINPTTRFVNPTTLRGETTMILPSRMPPTTVQKEYAEETPFEPMIDPALLGMDEKEVRALEDAPPPAHVPMRGFPEPANDGSALELRSSLVPSRVADQAFVAPPALMENIPDFPPEPAPELPATAAEVYAPSAAAAAEPLPPAAPMQSDVAPASPPPLAEAAFPGAQPPLAVQASPTEAMPPATPAVPAGPSAGELAEAVYFQVLQNLDLHTERALQRELTVHLAPIIERANRELLATLHANLGALMRQFIADAIEKQLGVRPADGDQP